MNRLQLTYRGFPPSEALSEKIREHAEKLDGVFEGIVACKVTVEQPHHHHEKGRKFHVNVLVEVPGKEIAATKSGQEAENAYAAVSEAFGAAKTQLLRYAKVLKGETRDRSREAPVEA